MEDNYYVVSTETDKSYPVYGFSDGKALLEKLKEGKIEDEEQAIRDCKHVTY
jgi:GTPase